MSNLDLHPAESVCDGRLAVATEPERTLLPGREVVLGGPRGTLVRRTLPHRDRRMVGAWCFADHYGPEDIVDGPGMRVPPHPHTGLQTVSWLIEGDVLHRDSLGNEQLVRPGQLNLMTAGRGISHSEESPRERPPVLHGVQLWVALPDVERDVEPDFTHHPDLPRWTEAGASVTVLMGEIDGATSPARLYTPLVAADIALAPGAVVRLPLRHDFEYATLGLSGTAEVDGVALDPGPLLYLGTGRAELTMRADAGQAGQVLLLGGEPFEERIIMWWNLVGRSHDEVVQAREDWMAGRRFGTVQGYNGDPLPAPAMPTTPLKPRGRHR
ncbi:MAG TPA: pirin family protein [Streptosporangiaceae bacterium]